MPSAPVIIPEQCGIFRWWFSLSGDTQLMAVTCGIRKETGATVQQAVDQARSAFASAFASNTFGQQYALERVTATIRSASILWNVENNTRHQGTATPNDYLPNNVALLVRKVTGLSGREHRGRMYLPPCFVHGPQIGQTGDIASADLSAVQTRLNTWFAALSDGTVLDTPVILHTESATETPITSFSLQTKVATQRQRLRP